ncbi:MAG TPA: 5-formyltetrahydrofolate cyclo-ligase [Kiritimatiellia bacterium]|jgi:5-formyltetrahydrofolate cyclo-ligase|nr:5-formyltetrahydrofolate cyclo-ligase [Candidatus Latescibacterota bacterium]HOR98321.1 5-formyltetrahydrofolate cyclo-ligase [Kiritimatiellia bacterium]HPK38108.1 5-formyltetrahydrofolate cyclo-ligase [Kiritimatiellia bacterium]HRU19742.1 5-formyltetrahydrofolate cyclo-ligase [Kiritimatiellia bacterium]
MSAKMPDATDSKEAKQSICDAMREKRRAVSQETRREAGRAICERVIGPPLNLLMRTWRICIYLSTRNEIPTRYIAREIWNAGREVCVPAWSTSENGYRLYAIDPAMRLISGHHGVREPEVRIPVMPWDVQVFIVPGLVFDTRGGRLGYGAGYYDRILAQAPRSALKIAVCYDWQVIDTPLPQKPHDIPMDWIVTEQRALRCETEPT